MFDLAIDTRPPIFAFAAAHAPQQTQEPSVSVSGALKALMQARQVARLAEEAFDAHTEAQATAKASHAAFLAAEGNDREHLRVAAIADLHACRAANALARLAASEAKQAADHAARLSTTVR